MVSVIHVPKQGSDIKSYHYENVGYSEIWPKRTDKKHKSGRPAWVNHAYSPFRPNSFWPKNLHMFRVSIASVSQRFNLSPAVAYNLAQELEHNRHPKIGSAA